MNEWMLILKNKDYRIEKIGSHILDAKHMKIDSSFKYRSFIQILASIRFKFVLQFWYSWNNT